MIDHLHYVPTRDMARIESLLASWVSDFNLKNVYANLVLSPDESTIMLTEAPEVEDNELRQAMAWKLKDSTEIDTQNSIIDCFSIPGQRQRGRQPMAYIVAADKSKLQQYSKLVDKSNLKLKSIDISAMAQRNVASMIKEDQAGVAFLQLEAGYGQLTISRNGDLYLAREIDVGYQQFKHDTDMTQDDGAIPNSMQMAVDNIILEIQRSLDYYERYFGQAPIQTLVVAPLPLKMPNLMQYFSNHLGIKAHEFDLTQVMEFTGQAMQHAMQSRFLPAIGAALRFNDAEARG